MSDLGYLIWLVATAIMTITVLTVGTLASAGLLTRSKADAAPRPGAEGDRRPRTSGSPEPSPGQSRRAA